MTTQRILLVLTLLFCTLPSIGMNNGTGKELTTPYEYNLALKYAQNGTNLDDNQFLTDMNNKFREVINEESQSLVKKKIGRDSDKYKARINQIKIDFLKNQVTSGHVRFYILDKMSQDKFNPIIQNLKLWKKDTTKETLMAAAMDINGVPKSNAAITVAKTILNEVNKDLNNEKQDLSIQEQITVVGSVINFNTPKKDENTIEIGHTIVKTENDENIEATLKLLENNAEKINTSEEENSKRETEKEQKTFNTWSYTFFAGWSAILLFNIGSNIKNGFGSLFPSLFGSLLGIGTLGSLKCFDSKNKSFNIKLSDINKTIAEKNKDKKDLQEFILKHKRTNNSNNL